MFGKTEIPESRDVLGTGDELRQDEAFPSVCPVANSISLAKASEQIRLLCSGNTHKTSHLSTSTHTVMCGSGF